MHRIANGIAARPECEQHIPPEGKEHRRKRSREDQHQGCAVAENLFRRRMVAPAHHDGCAGRTAHARQRRKGGDNHNQRHAHADVYKRQQKAFAVAVTQNQFYVYTPNAVMTYQLSGELVKTTKLDYTLTAAKQLSDTLAVCWDKEGKSYLMQLN